MRATIALTLCLATLAHCTFPCASQTGTVNTALNWHILWPIYYVITVAPLSSCTINVKFRAWVRWRTANTDHMTVTYTPYTGDVTTCTTAGTAVTTAARMAARTRAALAAK